MLQLKAVATLIVKRLIVWLAEVVVEAFLLGVLFGTQTVPFRQFVALLPGVWVLGFAVGVFLFLHWYYLSRAIIGLVWRSRKTWLYPAIAAAIFVAHMYVLFVRLRPDTSARLRAIELPFLAGGAGIVFICAVAGNRLLRKWV